MAEPSPNQPGDSVADQSPAAEPVVAHVKRSWLRWVVPVLSLGVTVAAGLLLYNSLRSETWSYFTDEQGLRVEVDEGRHREVLWDDPKQSTFGPSDANDEDAGDGDAGDAEGVAERIGEGRVEAAFSPDGTAMVLTHREAPNQAEDEDAEDEKPNADLYLSTWDGRTWSKPQPLTQLNSPADERGAAFSNDGKRLFFSSNREGGAGGYDLYVSDATDTGWGAAAPLSGSINTAANETGPAPAADGSALYFTSDRDAGKSAQDIYFARLIAPVEGDESKTQDATETEAEAETEAETETETRESTAPAYAAAQPAGPLNSSADDVEAVTSERGGYVFLASDRAGEPGLQLYLSRVVDGQAHRPERIDVYIDRANVTDPAVRMDGFDLLFSTDADLAAGEQANASGEQAFGLYRSTTREVIGYFDLSRWEAFKTLLDRVMWWLLLALAALVGIIYLLEKWRDITSLYHKCLAGSVIAHLLVLFLMMSWLISQQIDAGGEPQSPEVALSIDALAQEELAMESEQELAQVAATTRMVVTKAVTEFREVEFDATDVVVDPVAIVRQTSPQSLVSSPLPSAANESDAFEPLPVQDQALPPSTDLSPTLLPDLEVAELEVKIETDAPPVDLTEDDFKPDPESLQKVQTTRLELEKIESASIDVRSDSESVPTAAQSPATTSTGGETVNPSAGLETDQPPPKLDGIDAQAALAANLPGLDPLDAVTAAEKLETPDHELDPKALTRMVRKNTGKPSIEVIEQLGGSEGTERAIAMGLDWLTRHQEPDGHWDMSKHGSTSEYNTAGAGLALLCYYGWGIKHGEYGDDTKHPQHREAVAKALDWLIKQQKPDGDLRNSNHQHAMYCHGIASIALCEAYALTADPELKDPATRAIQFILDAQHDAGGWRYKPGQAGDLSVTGWQLMALHSASMAGIDVPDDAFNKARDFLDACSGGKQGGRYGYTGPSGGGPAMTPTGMFLRQLDLAPPTEPRMLESAQYMQANMLKPGKRRFYYEYYATLALYQHQGPVWQEWNQALKKTYLASQTSAGEHKGSWDPELDANFAKRGGRVTTTGLAVLSLEVYYRLLPLYGYDREAQ